MGVAVVCVWEGVLFVCCEWSRCGGEFASGFVLNGGSFFCSFSCGTMHCDPSLLLLGTDSEMLGYGCVFLDRQFGS